MKPLAECLEKLVSEGYTEDFTIKGDVLLSFNTKLEYTHEQVHVQNFYRFEGPSSPDDNAIMYAIETNDGSKGTLIDSYGVYSDTDVNAFMQRVEDIHKKVERT